MTKAGIVFVMIAGVWAGLILGISFIATPAKFLAPSITLPVALDVGRATFRIGFLLEMAFGLVLLTAGAMAYGWGRTTLVVIALLVALAAQRFALLPVLDARADLVMAGTPLPHHGITSPGSPRMQRA